MFDCVSDLSGVFKVLSVQFALVWSTGYGWCSCVSALFVLKTVILSYILASVFLVPHHCEHHDRRPDLHGKRRPFTSLCFVQFFPAAWSHRSSFRHSPDNAWEFGKIAWSQLIQACYPRGSHDHRHRPRLRSHARRRPRLRSLAHHHRPWFTLAQSTVPWIQSTNHGQECRSMSEGFKSCRAHRNSFNSSCLVLSCSWRHVWGRKWKRLLGDIMRAPDITSCPEWTSASELSPRRASCSCV